MHLKKYVKEFGSLPPNNNQNGRQKYIIIWGPNWAQIEKKKTSKSPLKSTIFDSLNLFY